MDMLRELHFFRRVPSDVSEGTSTGGLISLIGAAVMLILFVSECAWYTSSHTVSRVVLDNTMDEVLALNFNITMLHLPCKYASIDLEDRHGNHQLNVTGNVVKFDVNTELGTRSEHQWVSTDDELDELGPVLHPGKHTVELDGDDFQEVLKESPFTAVSFFSITPDCELSQLWVPGWETVALKIKENTLSGEIQMVSVNCSSSEASMRLCKEHGILGTPAIRVYHGQATMKDGYVDKDAHHISQMPNIETNKNAMQHLNREYHGHRMVDLVAEWIVQERQVSSDDKELDKVAQSIGNKIPGCEISGVLKVTRAPGNFHLSCHSPLHTFDVAQVNTTHVVNGLYFGDELSAADIRMLDTVRRSSAWPTNYLAGRDFVSHENVTIHHYLKVVTTRISPPEGWFQFKLGSPLQSLQEYLTAPEGSHRAYQYTSTRTQYRSPEELPAVKFSWDLAPLQVILSDEKNSGYRFGSFLTSLCAVIGGVYVVTGIIDDVLYHTIMSSVSFNKKFNKSAVLN